MATQRKIDPNYPSQTRHAPGLEQRDQIDPMDPNTLIPEKPEAWGARRTCGTMGLILVVLGLLGLLSPYLLGTSAHLLHSFILLVSGITCLWVDRKKSLRSAAGYSIFFGVFFGLLGIGGFLAGTWTETAEVPRFFLRLVPRLMELKTSDHILHLVLATPFLISGLATRRHLKRNYPRVII